MMIKDWKREIFSIPNLFSLFRLILIPVYMSIYLTADRPVEFYLAGAVLAVSCITDLVDGKIARHYNMITTVGKILDPLADKATQVTLIICLAIRKPILRILVGLFVIKESFQLIAGFVAIKHGRILKGAQLSGKVCTTVLFISLILMVMFPDLSNTTVTALTIIDFIFLSIAFGDYIVTYYKGGNKFQKLSENNAE